MLKIEKIELVKRIIRSNEYRNYEATHEECISRGIKVNRHALDRFAEKLEMIDKAQRPKLGIDGMPPLAHSEPTIISDFPTESGSGAFDFDAPLKHADSDEPLLAPNTTSSIDYVDVQKRQQEITYELGALRIKENELLQELQALKAKQNH